MRGGTGSSLQDGGFYTNRPRQESSFMPHVNAPLTPTGRLRIVLRLLHDGAPKVHMAAGIRASRSTLTT
jgi:hypothetical protein